MNDTYSKLLHDSKEMMKEEHRECVVLQHGGFALPTKVLVDLKVTNTILFFCTSSPMFDTSLDRRLPALSLLHTITTTNNHMETPFPLLFG
jgi:hypothetical protein